jgi:protein arginine N-methyltransferase 5
VFKLLTDHLSALEKNKTSGTTTATGPKPDPIVPPLTPQDTSVFPSAAVNTYTGFISPWLDLGSPNPVIASVSRQVLNLEINYASFCGIRLLVLPGPERDGSSREENQSLAQYSRAVQEALAIGGNMSFVIHVPMYREPCVNSTVPTLSSLIPQINTAKADSEVDLYAAWASWNHVRNVCNYSLRLFVGKMECCEFHFQTVQALTHYQQR